MIQTTKLSEPTLAALGGDAPGRVIKRYLLAVRPKFFAASLAPIIIGSGWGVRESGTLDGTAFALATGSVLCLHAAANVLNDVFDDISGNDRLNDARIHPYTGGSRFIQNGILDTGQMARWGSVLLVAAAVLGIGLVALKGFGVIAFGIAGLVLGIFYSAPPLRFSAHGFGELSVALAFGVLPVLGTTWLQTDTLSASALLISVPVTLWVTAILLINEVPDAVADGAVGRRTLVVRLGRAGTRRLYTALHGVAALGVVAVVAAGLLPAWSLVLPAILFLVAARAGEAIARDDDDRLRKAIELTLAIHGIGSLWLAGWVWAAALI